ncbi:MULTISPECIES: L,D-transpeptidase family protein [Streptomyces]|uniref:L,D-transpeptidase family protein n=1 Tax=Streptomyces fimbriatus TaxID=68197 RepID=A0ABW0DER3_STRFI
MASSIDCPSRARHRAPSRGDRQTGVLVRARGRLPLPAVLLAVLAALVGCGAGTGGTARDTPAATAPAGGPPGAAGTAQGGTGAAGTAQGGTGAVAETTAPADIPGLGPRMLAQIPGDTRQVVVVTGRGRNDNRSEAVLYRRTASGWRAGTAWPAHNALRGWTDDHYAGDLRSPIGVFTLSDAGGLLPDPGTELPYDQSEGFIVGGTGFEGEPLAGSFDYVVAIDYNREPGTSPLDGTRPLGADKGGGIWLHVDHQGPTQGCVSLEKRHMRELLRALDPDQNPVIVMGDAGSLGR